MLVKYYAQNTIRGKLHVFQTLRTWDSGYPFHVYNSLVAAFDTKHTVEGR